jgi:hypothetical protein
MNGRINPGFMLLGVVILAICLASCRVKTRHAANPEDWNGNPNKFVVWKTNSSIHYTFNYDPHAADGWLFESSGQSSNQTNHLSPLKPKWIWTN